MKWLAVLLGGVLVLSTACGGSERVSMPSKGDQTSSSVASQPAESSSTDAAIPSDTRVIMTSSIDLEVDSVRDAYDAISGRVQRAGGFIAQGQVGGVASGGSAMLRIRVPAARHDELLASAPVIPRQQGAPRGHEQSRSDRRVRRSTGPDTQPATQRGAGTRT